MPFLVGGVICLVNSVNERDLSLLNSLANLLMGKLAVDSLGPRGSACDAGGSGTRS